PVGATPSRLAMAHMLPSLDATSSASAILNLSRLTPTPYMAPVYASDLALPRRPQDSVPACPLRLWPGETLTHKSSSASPNALRQVQQIVMVRVGGSFKSLEQHPFVRSEMTIPSSRPACWQSAARSGSQGCRRGSGG